MAVPVIQSILARPGIDVNAPIGEGTKTTALHAAAESGRADVGESPRIDHPAQKALATGADQRAQGL